MSLVKSDKHIRKSVQSIVDKKVVFAIGVFKLVQPIAGRYHERVVYADEFYRRVQSVQSRCCRV